MQVLNLLVIAILCLKSWSALFEPSLAYGSFDAARPENLRALLELAGRNLSMIALTALAMWRAERTSLALVFAMHFVRESFDMGLAFKFEGIQALSFAPFLLAYALAIRQLLQARPPEAAQ
ncbi:MAG: hypothetical protein K1X75_01690 [Leptospirales bacterium]|nr:hypothetical protein [Leptospirales bacterium]